MNSKKSIYIMCIVLLLIISSLAMNVNAKTSTTDAKDTDVKNQKIVAIDPGHSSVVKGGTEPIGPGSSVKKAKDASGTCGVATKVPEYKLNLTIAKQLKDELEERGYKVVMTRKDNKKAISCAERAQIANKAKADIFIRIHADGINNSSVSGSSALYPTSSNRYVGKYSASSKKLSQCMLDAMCKKTGFYNRGLSGRDDLTGTNWAKMPVTLIEMGFMTNPTQDRQMQKKSYQKKMVQGMADGIDRYFKKSTKKK